MAIHLNIEAEDAQHLHSQLQYLAGIYERGVDDDDGTVDHNLTGDIDVHDGTWERAGSFDLDNAADRRRFLDHLANGPVVTSKCGFAFHGPDDCALVISWRKRA